MKQRKYYYHLTLNGNFDDWSCSNCASDIEFDIDEDDFIHNTDYIECSCCGHKNELSYLIIHKYQKYLRTFKDIVGRKPQRIYKRFDSEQKPIEYYILEPRIYFSLFEDDSRIID